LSGLSADVAVSATATLAAKMQTATGADNRQIADNRYIALLILPLMICRSFRSAKDAVFEGRTAIST
jgi:hypothetical protein